MLSMMDSRACMASFVSMWQVFFPDYDHGANNRCSTKKWKEADVYM